MTRYLSVREVEETFAVPPSRLDYWLRSGRLEQAYKEKGAWRISEDELEDLLEGAREADADMTIDEFAEHIGRHRATVNYWVSKGYLPDAYKHPINGKWRIPPDANMEDVPQ